jgi:hypothetical protein
MTTIEDWQERAERAEAEADSLRTTVDNMRTINMQLTIEATARVMMLRELANDLASEIEARYERVLDHPAMKMRYDRDMEIVERARAILGEE